MAHEFIILVDGELKTYHQFDDIPKMFDNLIKFVPEIPDGPHTHDDHAQIEMWNEKLKALIKRETNGNDLA